MRFNGIVNTILNKTKDHSPTILLGMGLIGMGTSVVLAVRATKKTEAKVADLKKSTDEPVTKKDVVKTVWKDYIPTGITFACSSVCLFESHRIQMKRSAAAVIAYEALDSMYHTYRDCTRETVGDEKANEIDGRVAKRRVAETPTEQFVIPGDDDVLCCDLLYGRYFLSNMNKIDKAFNTLNRDLLSYDTVILNDFYWALGMDGVSAGDSIGWNISKDPVLVEPRYTSTIAPNGRPCLAFTYSVEPSPCLRYI